MVKILIMLKNVWHCKYMQVLMKNMIPPKLIEALYGIVYIISDDKYNVLIFVVEVICQSTYITN